MIIKEFATHYELIHQHDHALLSGEMAFHSGKSPFKEADFQTVLTATLHDLSWIESDKQLTKPYDFTNYPLLDRLNLYRTGIDKTEQLDPYAALLTSMHYCAFLKRGKSKEVDHFLQEEEHRQKKLSQWYHSVDLSFALRQLKMWDNLSLYVCLNEPGTTKTNEHIWFKNGIQGVTADGKDIMIHGKWRDEKTVIFSPFPFKRSWTAHIPVYHAEKPFPNLQNEQLPRFIRAITFQSEDE